MNPKPSIWVFDVLNIKKDMIKEVKKKDIPVVCFDYLDGRSCGTDLIINGITGCWNGKESFIGRESRVINGPNYIIIDSKIRKFWDKSRIKNRKIKIMISMGVSDTYGTSVEIAKFLPEVCRVDAEVTFLLGPQFKHEKKLSRVIKNYNLSYKIKKSMEDIHRELSKADIVFCNGGQTLFELCAMGKDIIAIANESHEERTIDFVAKRHACINAGSVHKHIDYEKIKMFFKRFQEKREKNYKIDRKPIRIIDGMGAYRCYCECKKLIR